RTRCSRERRLLRTSFNKEKKLPRTRCLPWAIKPTRWATKPRIRTSRAKKRPRASFRLLPAAPAAVRIKCPKRAE
ncbi:hypothetical protein FisN_2Hh108, partial [Fistulifera solaris]